jgi:hypothetical protein
MPHVKTLGLGTGALGSFLFAATLFAQAAPAAQSVGQFFGKTDSVRLTGTGCNATSLSQVPGHGDLFLGRQLITDSGANDCSGSKWEIVLDRFDWKSHVFSIVHIVLKPPFAIDGGAAHVTSAYDPYVVRVRDEFWIAFECVGDGITGTSTCIAPLNLAAGSIDQARTYVVIIGNRPAPGDQYSASDPKMLVHGGHVYLYWSAILLRNGKWISVATRGTMLEQEKGPMHRLWPSGAGHATNSYDPGTNQEVWTGADMYSLIERGGSIYATAAAAHGDCVTPRVDEPDCFQLIMAKVDAPLGPNIFGSHLLHSDLLPANPQEYARFAIDPGGKVVLIDHVLPPHPSQQASNVLPQGLMMYPIELKRVSGN